MCCNFYNNTEIIIIKNHVFKAQNEFNFRVLFWKKQFFNDVNVDLK